MTIKTTRSDAGLLSFDVHIGAHLLHADEPLDAGGADTGPTPHDLFDAALGACKSITVSMYAKRKGWPLEDIQVSVERHDGGGTEGNYRLVCTIGLLGPLDAQQRARLMEIADRCPIHRLMQSTIEISSAELI